MFDLDARYAETRMMGSWFMCEGKVLEQVDAIVNTKGNDLSTSTIVMGSGKSYNIKDIAYAPGKLGYVKTKTAGFLFIERIPVRRDYRQGLRENQLVFSKTGYSRPEAIAQGNWIANNSENVAKCLLSKYDYDMQSVLFDVEDIGEDVAFSKNFAINAKYELMYKGINKVGRLSPKTDAPVLGKSFEFLEQELELALGGKC